MCDVSSSLVDQCEPFRAAPLFLHSSVTLPAAAPELPAIAAPAAADLAPPQYDQGGPANMVMLAVNMDGTRDPPSTPSGAGGAATNTHERALRPLVKGAIFNALRFPCWFRFPRVPEHSHTWLSGTAYPLTSNPVSD